MLFKITKQSSKSGITVERSDKDLTLEQAIERLAKHEKMWVKYGAEMKEKADRKLVMYDKEGDETVTFIITEQE